MAEQTILIADDSPTIVAMLTALLEGAGYRVVTAENGVAAVEQALIERPQLVMLDVTMPHMNGYQACRLIKSEAALRDTPVLLLTSRDQVGDKFWGAQSGADRYLTKDCPPGEILEVVGESLAARPATRVVAPPLEARQGDSLDLLTRLTNLLERHLFQTTVLNEIARLARSLQDVEQCANAVMKTLSQLVDYHLAAVALAEDERGELYVRQTKPVTPSCLDRFEEHCFNVLGAHLGRVPRRDRWVVSITDETQGGSPCDDLEQVITLPLESEDRPVGLLALAVIPRGSGLHCARQRSPLPQGSGHGYHRRADRPLQLPAPAREAGRGICAGAPLRL
jgi:CheY-like chemotaxis protein